MKLALRNIDGKHLEREGETFSRRSVRDMLARLVRRKQFGEAPVAEHEHFRLESLEARLLMSASPLAIPTPAGGGPTETQIRVVQSDANDGKSLIQIVDLRANKKVLAEIGHDRQVTGPSRPTAGRKFRRTTG